MTASTGPRDVPSPAPAQTGEDRTLLAHLRLEALQCRAAARLDLTDACLHLSATREVSGTEAVRALVRTLDQALGRAPRFFRPGSIDRSFDEAWLMALVHAVQRGDEASATFLLRSRVAPSALRSTIFLLSRVATSDARAAAPEAPATRRAG
ncbi:hypothetical protein SAMN04490244_105167 [Tranquillimonas rosea]|uniref:Uncharacterized protein n=1 Tax=Tranquillimonas rosea TaxID=641238 RepID=A0A1H9UB52_9RHOB|nr:hypothetical protein [Tranquillimonas rosea]SES06676.1 hypothetical protein SAMN04490244_105167 [Tranquillimonas rosea]